MRTFIMPMLIPESLLQKEKDHVEGFAPECAWVTMGGSEKLEERLCVRPTVGDAVLRALWKHAVHSWRDLPKLYNQWCSVLRWEKDHPPLPAPPRVFVAGGPHHARHGGGSRAETQQHAERLCGFAARTMLAMPVVKGQKTDKEKFAGAEKRPTRWSA